MLFSPHPPVAGPPTPAQRDELRQRPAGWPVGRQRWSQLLFTHWTVDPAAVQATLPRGLHVDTFGGAAYVGIVPFAMERVRPAWLPPVPWLSWFLELNVRTYVHDDHGRPGVWFYSLDCNQPIAVALARRFFHLPYYHARMTASRRGGELQHECHRRDKAARSCRHVWTPGDGAAATAPGSLEYFLVERYLLFSADPAGRLYYGRVHHAPYRVSVPAVADFSVEPARLAGFPLEGPPASVLAALPVDVTHFSPTALETPFRMNPPHDSPVWLITGCSRGLGRALAAQALARGHRVIATARDPETLADLVAVAPDRCRALALDVADAAQVAPAVARAAEAFGRLDLVVNNAGQGLIGAVEENDEAQIARNFETNFFGALRVIRAALPVLRAQRSGHFVNISAAAVIANYPGFGIYGAAKWALEGLSESLAAEVRPLGLRVTIVQPGPFRTEFVARSLERATGSLPDYEPSSGKFRRLIESMNGRQPGDPVRAADAILDAVASENPPLRLVLGKYALDKARRKLASAARELEAGGAASLAADFPVDGAPGAAR